MSAAAAAAAAAAVLHKRYNNNNSSSTSTSGNSLFVSNYNRREVSVIGRYESQKLRDWNMFRQYLRNHRPALTVSRCSGADVMEFLRHLDDRFGKLTKVHNHDCPFFRHGYGHTHSPPSSASACCPCPIRQAWGGLDAIIGRLRVAFEENGGLPETNPFRSRAVLLYLKEVRDGQAKG